MMDTEKQYLMQLQHIEEDISRQRVQALQLLERSSKEEYELIDHVSHETKQFLKEKEKHMQEKTEMTLNLQKMREMGGAADMMTQEKMRQMNIRRGRDEVYICI